MRRRSLLPLEEPEVVTIDDMLIYLGYQQN